MQRKVKNTDLAIIKKLIYENYPPAEIAIDYHSTPEIIIDCEWLGFKALAALYASGYIGYFAYKKFKIVEKKILSKKTKK